MQPKLSIKRYGKILLFILLPLIIGIIGFQSELFSIEENGLSLNNHGSVPISNPYASDNPIMMELYVSPDGDDLNWGNDTHPFKTIERAQEEVQINCTDMDGDIIVWIHEGTYRITETLFFNQSDSSSNGFNIIYRNHNNEEVIISGGVPVTGWVLGANGIWQASTSVEDFRQLYVNGSRVTRARGEPTMIISSDGDGHRLSDTSIASWGNPQHIEIVYNDIWTLPRIHIQSFSADKKRIYMQQPAYGYARTKGGTVITDPEWIENAFELLNEPGEWYFNNHSGIVYYKPRAFEDMSTVEVIAPYVDTLVEIEGNSTEKVKNLYFQGLNFQHSTWLEPNRYGQGFVDLQANVYLTYAGSDLGTSMSPGSVITRFASNILFENCSFMHLGAGGLDFQEGSNQSSVYGSVFNDISGIGVQIGEVSHPEYTPENPRTVRNINVINNYIVNCSVEYMGGPGIFTGYVRNIRIEHNSISNLPYTGISCGWGWSPLVTVCANNSIKFNHIYGVMNYLIDGGGIYTLSTQAGTNVSYNVIHDSGWNGLYPDERTNQTYWTYNVIWDTDNNILDHTMYEESIWNVMVNNYAEDYPKYLWVWYPDRDGDQIWGLRPGDTGFPQWIVDMAGVQPEYRHLIPENEQYWQYRAQFQQNGLAGNPIVFLLIVFGLIAFTGLGLYAILRPIQPNKIASVNRENIVNKMEDGAN
jgi:hypothetical protein